MSAWDATSFGNDTANDWFYVLERGDDLRFIEDTLSKVISAGDVYLDAVEAEEAIAAIEVLAWLCGKPCEANAYTEKVNKWVSAHSIEVPDSLIETARTVLDRIRTQPSELAELWEGQDEWEYEISNLYERLSK